MDLSGLFLRLISGFGIALFLLFESFLFSRATLCLGHKGLSLNVIPSLFLFLTLKVLHPEDLDPVFGHLTVGNGLSSRMFGAEGS